MAYKPSKACIYRQFDKDGNLLYLGYSSSLMMRVFSYRGCAWYRDIATITIEHFPNAAQARAAEKEAIFKESPKYNTQYIDPEKKDWK